MKPERTFVIITIPSRKLFLELWGGRRIRHLGMHTGRAKKDNPCRQMSLFDEIDYEKLAIMDKTVDTLRKRFGANSIKRAVFLNQPIAHMCGGISKEKEPSIMIR